MKRFVLLLTPLLLIIASTNVWSTGVLNLPSPMTGNMKLTLTNSNDSISYWEVDLSNVLPTGYVIGNGKYYGWCADSAIYIYPNSIYKVNIYDTTANNLPIYAVTPEKWKPVNYILNHKGNNPWQAIQLAIWKFTDGIPEDPLGHWYNEYNKTFKSQADALYDEASANGKDFIPKYGEKVAVLLDANNGSQGGAGESNQLVFVEATVPVPEPGTFMLLGTGLVGIAGYARLRLHKRSKVVNPPF